MARQKSIILLGCSDSSEKESAELEQELTELERNILAEREAYRKHIEQLEKKAQVVNKRLAKLKEK